MSNALIGFAAVGGILHLFLVAVPLKDTLLAPISARSKAAWSLFLLLLPYSVWRGLLLIDFEVVEDSVEIHGVELDRNLDRWVLSEMDHWRRLLVLKTCNFDAVSLLWSDFLAIEDDQGR